MNFCPHCGEDVSAFTAQPAQTAAPAAPPAPPARSVLKRQVTDKEVSDLWGSAPLPFQIKPYGLVIVDEEPVALACSDLEGKDWALANGETLLLGDVGIPEIPTEAVAGERETKLLANHLCSTDGLQSRQERGQARYGGQK